MAYPAIGEAAPDFELSTDDGGSVSLADLRGSKVVLYFYPKDDTSGCTTEALDFSSRAADFDAARAIVIGVSPDSLVQHGKFRKKHGLTIRLAADPERAAIEAYGVWQEKSMYGKKYMGVVRSTFLIDAEGRIADAWTKVKVAGHAEAVLAAVKAL
ncbi:peroxiredoxin [Kaistia algarum]|uniref:peroxiredoxin n=1 Tax=Kaistia algarum TaxID=2083279 RepID=UPI000CE9354E|nr:peroxiredoxin [Kaistia algarum]MCX5515229.1 peroxiredoxin [Kaistia algarum]PPE79941.1 peroxiredoxin [Kaistia algarum]